MKIPVSLNQASGKLKPFGFDHPKPEGLVCAKWHTFEETEDRTKYAILRAAIALYLLAWLPYLIYLIGPKFFFIYFTDWGYLLITLDACLHAFLAFRHRRGNVIGNQKDEKAGSESSGMPKLFKVSWFVTAICSATSFTISLGYWIMIYAYLEVRLPIVEDLQMHLVNSLYVVFSVAVSARPFKWQHQYVPVAELLVYLLFTYFYYLAGGRNMHGQEFIYSFLNFRDLPKLFTFGAILAAATVVCHGLLCLVDFGGAKLWAWRRPECRGSGRRTEPADVLTSVDCRTEGCPPAEQ